MCVCVTLPDHTKNDIDLKFGKEKRFFILVFQKKVTLLAARYLPLSKLSRHVDFQITLLFLAFFENFTLEVRQLRKTTTSRTFVDISFIALFKF